MNILGISLRKSRGEPLFLTIAALSACLAVTVISAAPLYFDSIERLGLRRTLDSLDSSQIGSSLHISEVTFNRTAITATNELADEIGEELGDAVRAKASFIRSGRFIVSRINDEFAQPGTQLTYQSITGQQPAISLVRGVIPTEPPSDDSHLEVAVVDSVAEQLQLDIGDALTLTVPPTTIVHSEAEIVGIFSIDDPNHESWQGLSRTLFYPEQGPTGGRPPLIALTSHETMMSRIAERGIADVGQLWQLYYVDVERLKQDGISKSLSNITRFRSEASRLLPTSSTITGIESSLRTLQRQLAYTHTSTVISGALFAAFAVFVLVTNASIISRRWASEEVALKARGADRNQLLGALSTYAAIAFALPAIFGPLLASAIVPLLGVLGSFEELTQGRTFPYRLMPEQYLWSLTASSLLLAIFIAPYILARPGPISTYFSRIRVSGRPWFWRANLDFGIVIAAAAIIFELNGRGSLFIQRGAGQTELSTLAASLPVFASIAAALIALRLIGFVGIIFERISRLNVYAMFTLALRVFSRSTMQHAVIAMVAAGMTLVVINAIGLSATLGENVRDRAEFQTAADIRVSGVDTYRAGDNAQVDALRSLDWIDEFAWGTRSEARSGSAESAAAFGLLAVRPKDFAKVAEMRRDFADLDLGQLMASIDGFSPTGSIAIPPETITLTATIRLQRVGSGRLDVWARVLDRDGTTHTIRLVPDVEPSVATWHDVFGDVSGLAHPLRLLAIQIYQPPTSELGNALTFEIDSIMGSAASGRKLTISKFEDPNVWHPISTSIADDTAIAALNDGGERSNDGRAIRVKMGRGTADGVRGVYYSEDEAIVVPAVVNSQFLEDSSLNVGDTFIGTAYSRLVPFQIRDTFELFPTMRETEQPFAVANFDALLSYLTTVSEPFFADSAEIYASILPGTSPDERRSDVKAIDPSLRIVDREDLLNESSTRLGDAAGWRIVGAVVAVSTVLIATITAFAITVQNQDATRLDSALVESLGGSRIGIVIEAYTRVLLALIMGFALGTVSGILAVRFIADRMTRTPSGETALPPMLLHVDVLPVVAGMLVLLVTTLIPILWRTANPSGSVALRIRFSQAR